MITTASATAGAGRSSPDRDSAAATRSDYASNRVTSTGFSYDASGNITANGRDELHLQTKKTSSLPPALLTPTQWIPGAAA